MEDVRWSGFKFGKVGQFGRGGYEHGIIKAGNEDEARGVFELRDDVGQNDGRVGDSG